LGFLNKLAGKNNSGYLEYIVRFRMSPFAEIIRREDELENRLAIT
jgi:hypothetical protein